MESAKKISSRAYFLGNGQIINKWLNNNNNNNNKNNQILKNKKEK